MNPVKLNRLEIDAARAAGIGYDYTVLVYKKADTAHYQDGILAKN
jgi:hypothetical protein